MTEKETVINREGNCNFISPEKDQRIEKDWRRKLCHPLLQCGQSVNGCSTPYIDATHEDDWFKMFKRL